MQYGASASSVSRSGSGSKSYNDGQHEIFNYNYNSLTWYNTDHWMYYWHGDKLDWGYIRYWLDSKVTSNRVINDERSGYKNSGSSWGRRISFKLCTLG